MVFGTFRAGGPVSWDWAMLSPQSDACHLDLQDRRQTMVNTHRMKGTIIVLIIFSENMS